MAASPASYNATTLPELQAIYSKLTVHHDAQMAAPSMTKDQAMERMRQHQIHHMQGNGWADIGYHYVISPKGLILAGRSIFSPGSHVYQNNTGNLGICLMGNFEQQTPPKVQIDALVQLAAWWCENLDIRPANIKGHQDFLATACPGETLYSELGDVRQRVADLLK